MGGRARSTDRWPLVARTRLATLLVLVAASAAVVATSQPPPTPAVRGTSEDSVTLTADTPIATVEFAVQFDGPPGDRSVIEFDPRVEGPQPQLPPVVVRFVDLQTRAPSDPSGALVVPVDAPTQPCAPPCEKRYRMIAVLADPGSGPATVTWSVTAGSHFPNGSAPPDARITVEAAAAVVVSGSTVSFASSAGEELAMGADHLRAVRTVDLAMPALEGGAGHMTSGLVVVPRVRSDGSPRAPVAIRVTENGELLVQEDSYSGLGMVIPIACPAACERQYDIELEWQGGDADSTATVELDVFAWAQDPESPDGLAISEAGRQDVTAISSRLTATTGVQRRLDPRARLLGDLSAMLDLRRATTGFSGLAIATVHTSAPAVSTMEIGVGDATSGTIEAGMSATVISQPVHVDCAAGEACPITFDVQAFLHGPGGPADVSLDVTVDVISTGVADLPAEAKLSASVAAVVRT